MSQRVIKIRCKGSSRAAVDELENLQGDLKKITEDNLEKLKSSITKNGFTAPIFVWTSKAGNQYIIDGHQRVKALASLRDDGWSIPSVPIADIQARSRKEARRILLHVTSQYGDFDGDALAALISESDFSIPDLDIRLPSGELEIPDLFVDSLGGNGKEKDSKGDDEIPDDINTVTKPGDVWCFGRHHLLCADASSDGVISAFVGDHVVDLLLTDPPYNVGYDGSPTKQRKKIRNDNQVDYTEFLIQSIAQIKKAIRPGGVFYVWYAIARECDLQSALEANDLVCRQHLMWSKNHFVIGRSDYHERFEVCMYGWLPGPHHTWSGGGKQSTVFDIAKPHQSKKHPTMKPVELFTRLVLNSSNQGDVVFDPFSGSGTTLIVCQKTGRVFRGIEIDPHYCDVTASRYATWCLANGVEPRMRRIHGKSKAG